MKLALDAHELWNDLEAEAGEELRWMTGLLNFGNPDYGGGPEGKLLDPIENLKYFHENYRILNASEIMAEYPFANLPETYQGIFAEKNGVINVPLVLRTLYRMCDAKGVDLFENEGASSLNVLADGTIAINTAKDRTVNAGKVVLTTGAYMNQLTKSVGFEMDLQIWEMVRTRRPCLT